MKVSGKIFTNVFLSAAIIFTLSIPVKVHLSNALLKPTVKNQTAKESWNYKHWTQVNTKPVKMEASIAAMCAPASSQLKNDSPHKDKFIIVYVNEIGRKAMLTEKNPQFPEGSSIVKEKLPTENSKLPELLTAMIKREKGFNPPSNDWEFLVLSGDAKIIQTQGKLDNCIACHTAKRGNDFVFRNYLSNDDLMKLKD